MVKYKILILSLCLSGFAPFAIGKNNGDESGYVYQTFFPRTGHISGYKSANLKTFTTLEEAQAYLHGLGYQAAIFKLTQKVIDNETKYDRYDYTAMQSAISFDPEEHSEYTSYTGLPVDSHTGNYYKSEEDMIDAYINYAASKGKNISYESSTEYVRKANSSYSGWIFFTWSKSMNFLIHYTAAGKSWTQPESWTVTKNIPYKCTSPYGDKDISEYIIPAVGNKCIPSENLHASVYYAPIPIDKDSDLGASCNAAYGDPVNNITGNVYERKVYQTIHWVYPLELGLIYNSHAIEANWNTIDNIQLKVSGDSAVVTNDDGYSTEFKKNNNVWEPIGSGGALRLENGNYVYTKSNGYQYIFENDNLVQVKNPKGLSHYYEYHGSGGGLSAISDDFGHGIGVNYEMQYEPDSSGLKLKITYSLGADAKLTYQCHYQNMLYFLCDRIDLPNGKYIVYQYEDKKHPFLLTSALSNNYQIFSTWSHNDEAHAITNKMQR
ncbi:MAG: hypothetical protein O2809_04615 [Proteobacteria bacterium]|nr:hypothetical protein [Pseudomonadota bacterium]